MKININNIQMNDDISIPKVETLCIQQNEIDSENDNDSEMKNNSNNFEMQLIIDPFDGNVVRKYELMIENTYVENSSCFFLLVFAIHFFLLVFV